MNARIVLVFGVFVLGCGPIRDDSNDLVILREELGEMDARIRTAERHIRALEAEVYDGLKQNKEYVCDSILRAIRHAVDRYWDENGSFPTAGNLNLVRELGKRNRDGVPYFTFKPEMLNDKGEFVDPWGIPYVYLGYSTKKSNPRFVLYSCGKNGEDNGGKGDDLSVW